MRKLFFVVAIGLTMLGVTAIFALASPIQPPHAQPIALHFQPIPDSNQLARATISPTSTLPILVALDQTSPSGGQTSENAKPSWSLSWTEPISAAISRIAVGNTVADGLPRIVALGADKTTLSIWKWDGSAFTQEATVNGGSHADQYVVGNFTPNKPAEIVVPGRYFYWNGKKYTGFTDNDLTSITGLARFSDGTENFFYFDGSSTPATFSIDLKSGKNWLTYGRMMSQPLPTGSDYRLLITHGSPEMLQNFAPVQMAQAGVLGYIDPKNDGNLYGFGGWMSTEGPNAGNFLVVTDASMFGPMGMNPSAPIYWRSPKLDGKLLDIAPCLDPKDGKTKGFLVLLATGANGDSRTVQFYKLD
ncbi:MAG: hypothetical protein M1330_00250 [Armatimonadetes bacterium]|nr:hypothetical protein [Armatimonadota bacterium]